MNFVHQSSKQQQLTGKGSAQLQLSTPKLERSGFSSLASGLSIYNIYFFMRFIIIIYIVIYIIYITLYYAILYRIIYYLCYICDIYVYICNISVF